jgi:cytidine deaminase
VTDRELLDQAEAAAAGAYAPYSGFNVGAAALLRDGRVVTGVNVENAAYPLGICAERSVISAAVSAGAAPGGIEAIAVTASPCGGCRQWMAEFAVGRVVFPLGEDVVTRTPAELLPDSFEL